MGVCARARVCGCVGGWVGGWVCGCVGACFSSSFLFFFFFLGGGGGVLGESWGGHITNQDTSELPMPIQSQIK